MKVHRNMANLRKDRSLSFSQEAFVAKFYAFAWEAALLILLNVLNQYF